MQLRLKTISKTAYNIKAGIIRLILGGMFCMTGIMKLVVPSLGDAFAGQLQAASIPFQTFNIWFVPIVETIIGVILIAGLMSRLGALVIISLMAVATYVHLVVDDASLFPLQPEMPIIPIIVIGLGIYLLVVGGGAWSRDQKNS
jgi:uncharacterized membrane protein YphA (DoxX/SURF4 family)